MEWLASWWKWLVGAGVIAVLSRFILERLWNFLTRPPALRLSPSLHAPFQSQNGTYVFPMRIVFANPRSEGNAVTDIWHKVYGPSVSSVLKSIPRYWKVFRAHSTSGDNWVQGILRFASFVKSLLDTPEIKLCEVNLWPDSNSVFLGGSSSALVGYKREDIYLRGDVVSLPGRSTAHRFLLVSKDALDVDARVRIFAKDCLGRVFRSEKIALEI